jgi:hypothetical protein
MWPHVERFDSMLKNPSKYEIDTLPAKLIISFASSSCFAAR